jgi:hypothetical protein
MAAPPVAVSASPVLFGSASAPLPQEQAHQHDASEVSHQTTSAPPTPKTSAIDRQPGETQPREPRKWASNTFAETGSPMFNTPAVAVGTVVHSPSLFSSYSSALPVSVLPASFAALPSALPATILPATTTILPPAPLVTSSLPYATTTIAASPLPLYPLPAALPATGASITSNSLTWPTSFGAPAVPGSSAWSQASNSWVAPLPTPGTTSLQYIPPSDVISAYYSRPTNQGFLEAEIHTFSDNLQPGGRFGGYWDAKTNPGWNTAFSTSGNSQSP